MGDPFNLRRFVEAQEPVYRFVLRELREGRKESLWMWFVFPQFAGLGKSPTAELYAIRSLKEAEAYLADPILGPRVKECTELVLHHKDKSAIEIFGHPDDLKFRSSMTLFGAADPADAYFRRAIDQFFDGVEDAQTLTLAYKRKC